MNTDINMDTAIDTIFVQIASYRDPELIPTIRDCIENADFPENLRFGICWQRAEEDNIDDYIYDYRFTIIDVPYTETKGCCWARNKIQQCYKGEKYTLQLDSHHRFSKGWDTTLIQMYEELQNKGHKKPLITAYVPSYNPEKDPEDRIQVPWKIIFDRITAEKQILCKPDYVMNYKEIHEPIPAQFYSAHFAFTTGLFCKEVQHDPELYFTGEEMNITIRAFTHGYDLFHPHLVIAWHEYTRKNRQKHWDDDKEWWKKDVHSKNHYKEFLKKMEDMESIENRNKNSDELYNGYGLGKERTVKDYIQQTKINIFASEAETESKS